MDFEELIARYREISLKKRLFAIVFIALLPAANELLFNLGDLLNSINVAKMTKKSKQGVFQSYMKKKIALPKIEMQLKEREDDVDAARKKLPDVIHMDEILQKVEIIAQQLNVSMKMFKPGEEIPSETAFKFLKLPIKLELVGSYSQITMFFDKVAHLELLVRIQNFNFSLAPYKIDKNDLMSFEAIKKDQSPETRQEYIRNNTVLRASCDLILYRTLSEKEAQAVQSVLEKDKSKKNKATKHGNRT